MTMATSAAATSAVRPRYGTSQIRDDDEYVHAYVYAGLRVTVINEANPMRTALNVWPVIALCACALPAATQTTTTSAGGDEHLARARRVLASAPLVDGHNDLPWAIREYAAAPHDVAAYDLRKTTPGHTDIARLRRGQVGAQFWSVYV